VSADHAGRKLRARFSRRLLLLGGLQAAAFGALAWRLRQLQILESSEYRLLADENRLSVQLRAPTRGAIYDRFGKRLATNRENLRVILIPSFARDLEATLDAVAKVVRIPDAQRERVLRIARRQSPSIPIVVAEGLNWRQFALLNVLAPELPGVQTDTSAIRVYAESQPMAHVLGYVGLADKTEIKEDPVLRLPGFRLGKAGVEKGFDRKLRGRPGNVQYEVDVHGRIVRELGGKPSQAGTPLVLSIDHALQAKAMERIADHRRAAVVALDARTGEVLIMASTPTYDPNDITYRPTLEVWQELAKTPDNPLLNRTIAGQYPPGSTYKMIPALAGLAEGVIDPKERIVCPGGYSLGRAHFRCWKRGGHGAMDLHNALKQSCDVYFYETARRLGIERMAQTALKFGFGATYDCGLAGQLPGVVPTAAWKRRVLGQPWYGGETVIAGIGQGYVLATPLQLAVMTARIATGRAIVPRFTIAAQDELPVEPQPLDVDPEHLQLVRNGMAAVVNEGGGTATGSALGLPGVLMAGKTGTSQVRSRSRRGPERRSNAWDAQPHALFVAYAPVDTPRYAVSCIVEHGGGGSRAAAPIVRDIMLQLLERDPVGRPAFVAAPPATLAASIERSGADR
jgi:penicillin-binding protein 2